MIRLILLLPVFTLFLSLHPAYANDSELPLYAFELGGKYGFMDKKGNIIIAPQFDDAKKLFSSDGFGAASKDGNWGVINTKGEWIILPSTDFIAPINSSSSLVPSKKDGKWGLMDKKKGWLVEPRFDGLMHAPRSIYYAAKEYGGWGLLDSSGGWVLTPSTSFAYLFPMSENGLAGAKDAITRKCGFIDKQGKWVIEPRFSQVFWFEHGLAPAYENNKAGYIDKNGTWIIDPIFDEAFHFIPDGFALVQQSGKQGIINTSGEWIIPPEIPMEAILIDGPNSFYIITRHDGATYIDFKGNVLLEVDNSKNPAEARNGQGELVWTQEKVQDARRKQKADANFETAARRFPVVFLIEQVATRKLESYTLSYPLVQFGEAAKLGSVEAMFACLLLAQTGGHWDNLYTALAALEDMEPQPLQIDKLTKYGLWSPEMEEVGLGSDKVVDILYRALCQLYLLGKGTEQNFAKAKEVSKYINRENDAFPITDFHFDNPELPESRAEFWQFTIMHPEAAQFLNGDRLKQENRP